LFCFVGKSKIEHSIEIPQRYKSILKLLSKNKKDDDKLFNGLSSDELNCFLKEHMGKDYTCKDFRTYSANMLFIKYFLTNKKKVGEKINEKKEFIKFFSLENLKK
jgi:DNA topoisomerase IB